MTFQGHSRASTTEHKRWRRAVLSRDPICRCSGCKHHTGPCASPSTEADHIKPWSEGGPLTLPNGQGLCKRCHAQKTAYEGVAARGHNLRRRPTQPHPGLRP